MSKDFPNNSTRTYRLDIGFTTIEDAEKTLFIDYSRRLLYRYEKQSKVCTGYAISVNQKDPPAASIGSAFSEMILLAGEKEAGVSTAGKVQSVVFGRRAMLTRRVGKPVLHKFGMEFRPGRIDYLIDFSHSDSDKIWKIAEENKAIPNVDPLLDQVDTVRLIPLFGGVVDQEMRRTSKLKLEYEFLEKKLQQEQLEQLCSKPPII